MTKDELLQIISSNITDNNSGDITAEKLRNILNSMVEYTPEMENVSLDGYLYISTATPSTIPVPLTEDNKVFYIAVEEGDYSNFELGIISELSIIKSENGSWKAEGLGVPFDTQVVMKKAGTNKIDPSKIEIGKFSSTNVGSQYRIKSNDAYKCIITPVKPNTTYTATTRSPICGVRFVLTIDANGIVTQKKDVQLPSCEFTTAENDVKAIITFFLAAEPCLREGADTSFVEYNPIGGYSVEKIADNSIITSNITDGAVIPAKTNFFENVRGKNLYNPNAEDVIEGKYLNSSGGLSNNGSYVVTEYIPFTKDMHSIIVSYEGIGYTNSTYMWAYDSDKNKTHGVRLSESIILSWEEGDAYVRCSISKNLPQPQIEAGDVITSYEPYYEAEKIKESYLPEAADNKKSITYFHLPKHIYVAAGRTIELYYEQILLNSHLYNIQAQCPIGSALERKFQITGDADHIGNYALTISIYDNNGNKLKEATSTIHIVSNTIAEEIKVLPIGDSLTNNKAWLDELKVLSSSKITTVGTRGSISVPHEGRSGATVSNYTTESGEEISTFDGNYVGYGMDADEFSESVNYNKGDIVKIAHKYPYMQGWKWWVFTENHTAGNFDPSKAYCISGGNPFYDWETKSWSFTKYKQRNNINPDVIMIYLGTNGINLTPETNSNGALGIKNLIDKIRLEDANTPIIVVNTIFKSGQNGIGKQGNTDGYKAQSEYKFNADRKVLLLAKALDEMIGNYPNVYLCPVGFTHDSKYNFGNIKKEVNPRLTDTSNVWEIYPNESVHPQDAGYMQMADSMFSTICAI